ncbi:MAG: asparagine synthase (glutamine-hydrolyzing) [Planctomycetes bacterium]|nr:asparagine synthase (glutamine-hydrolyzing) [Planctomycetota bacterium]
MCGIVGIMDSRPVVDGGLLATMRDTMRHRGPDDAGLWWDDRRQVGLAHRRLSIIDLSPGGHQPMTDESGKLALVYNGEIYNYRQLREELTAKGRQFRSASDTEVILEAYRAWGTDCVAHLNGMFAFALYDVGAGRLFLARDRAGQKPLYYMHDGERLVFASELKAIMADPSFRREIDLEALDHYLAYGYVPGALCMLKGVAKLPPAHCMTCDLDRREAKIWRYWQLPDPPGDRHARSEEELLDEYHELLRDSVRRRLVADVPVGILLSGGIDSSLVTAMAAEVSSTPVKTFTIAFPGAGRFDEAPYARMVADHFSAEHTELTAEQADVDLLPELAAQFDEPMADSSMVPTYLVCRLIRRHATVALGGDGGDELFGGDLHHSWIQQQQRLRRFIPPPLRQLSRRAAGWMMRPGRKGRNYVLGALSSLPRSIAQINTYCDESLRRGLLAPIYASRPSRHRGPEAFKTDLCGPGRTPLQLATSVDFATYLPEDILVKVDRASMLTSLEVRAPFLDYRLIEFAFGRLGDSLRATLRRRKILSRRLADRVLPEQLDLKRKQGFSLPLQEWFKGKWGEYCREVLGDADGDLFDRDTINTLITDQRRGRFNTQRLFALTIFELWRRRYDVSIPGSSP